jgi:hypothetical protein
MKRICFDTESNYAKPATSAVGSIESSRAWIQHFLNRQSLVWRCGVIYDEELDIFKEFRNDQIKDFVAELSTADELISHSGSRHDLLLLEVLCGTSLLAPVLQIRHHDLFDLCNWTNLDQLSVRFIPEIELRRLRDEKDVRKKEIDVRYPLTTWGSTNEWRSDENFIAGLLSRARFDVARTFRVWEEVTKRADS